MVISSGSTTTAGLVSVQFTVKSSVVSSWFELDNEYIPQMCLVFLLMVIPVFNCIWNDFFFNCAPFCPITYVVLYCNL